jgi:anti-anti-sigma factor
MTDSNCAAEGSLRSESSSDQAILLPGELSITTARSHGGLLFTVRGELDIASAPRLEAELRRAETADVERVAIDLADVEFIDSSGLHALINARERLGRKGLEFSLSRVSSQVRRLLELTGTGRLLAAEALTHVSNVPGGGGRAA